MFGERTVSSWRIITKPVNKEKAGKQNAMKQKQAFPVRLALSRAVSEPQLERENRVPWNTDGASDSKSFFPQFTLEMF